MVSARAWYVYGVQLAYPNATRWISGPFEGAEAAHAERKRIAPRYPEATLSVRVRTGRSLPVRAPRGDDRPEPAGGGFKLSTDAGRREAAEALRAFTVDRLGLRCDVENWNSEFDVSCRAPGLLAHVWIAHVPAAPMPPISWVADDPRRLVAFLPGAWRETHPHRKATTEPANWPHLFDALEIGLLAALDGRAFDS